jgi:lysyl-tRNA synthetase class 2
MHSLVQEATGVDFYQYGDDMEAAKAAVMNFFEGHLERHDTGTILKSPSMGHLLNEVLSQPLQLCYLVLKKIFSLLGMSKFRL